MKRLIHDKGLNTPEEYDRIFKLREQKNVDHFDKRRWNALLKYFRGGRILDIGCLDSLVGPMAVHKYPNTEVWGIDVAEGAIKIMQQRYPDFDYSVQDAYHTNFPDKFFDYVVAGEVIEHLEDPKALIREAIRVLKPGGTFALSTPKDEEKEPGAVDGDRHIWSFSVDSVHNMLDFYGTVKIKVLGSQYFPTYKYCWPQLIAFSKKR